MKRREVGWRGLRCEYLVRVLIVPLSLPDENKRESYTPIRKGLRERKRADSPRLREPTMKEEWWPEERLPIWELKQFGEKLARKRHEIEEKVAKQQEILRKEEQQKRSQEVKAKVDEQLQQQRLQMQQRRQAHQAKTVSADEHEKRAAAFYRNVVKGSNRPTVSSGVKVIVGRPEEMTSSTPSGSKMSVFRAATTDEHSPPSITVSARTPKVSATNGPATLTISAAGSPASKPRFQNMRGPIPRAPGPRPSVLGTPTGQNLRIVHLGQGQVQVQGLRPGQRLTRTPDGKMQLITRQVATTPQPIRPSQAATTTTTSGVTPFIIQSPESVTASKTEASVVPSSPVQKAAVSASSSEARLMVSPAKSAVNNSPTVQAASANKLQMVLAHIPGQGTRQVLMTPEQVSAFLNSQTSANQTAAASQIQLGTTQPQPQVIQLQIQQPQAVQQQVPTLQIQTPGQLQTLGQIQTPGQPQAIQIQQQPLQVQTPQQAQTLQVQAPGQPRAIQIQTPQQPQPIQIQASQMQQAQAIQIQVSQQPLPIQIQAPQFQQTQTIQIQGSNSRQPQTIQIQTTQQPQLIQQQATKQSCLTSLISSAQTMQNRPQLVSPNSFMVNGSNPILVRTASGQIGILQSPAVGLGTVSSPNVQGITPKSQRISLVPATSNRNVSILPGTTSPSAALMAGGDAATAIASSASQAEDAGQTMSVNPKLVQQALEQAMAGSHKPNIAAKISALHRSMTGIDSQSVLPSRQLNPPSARKVRPKHEESVEAVEHSKRVETCKLVMQRMLDKIEKQERTSLRGRQRSMTLEQREQRKQQVSLQRQERAKASQLSYLLHRSKESLKADMVRKRSLVEKDSVLQAQVDVNHAKYSKSLEDAADRISTTSRKRKHSEAVTEDAFEVQPVAKKPARSSKGVTTPRKEKRRKSSDIKAEDPLYCVCKMPYDETKFYVGCDLCPNWFHGECIGISERAAEAIDSYICDECKVTQESSAEDLYCVCKTPYDESQFYVGCDRCQDWFHGSCVGVTKAMADAMDTYICPRCKEKQGGGALDQKRVESRHWSQLLATLKDLQGHKNAWPFQKPVSIKEVPDYFSIIKTPMDFATIQKKINRHKYTFVGDYVKDVLLVFANCRNYNPRDSPFYQCAEVMEAYFVQKVKFLQGML